MSQCKIWYEILVQAKPSADTRIQEKEQEKCIFPFQGQWKSKDILNVQNQLKQIPMKLENFLKRKVPHLTRRFS